MRFHRIGGLAAAAVVCLGASRVAAQQPTASQAQALLQANPQLVQQLQQRLAVSGMSRDQIRARLRAEGYPENLLDSYLPGATGAATPPSSELFAAVQQLGIVDSSDARMLQTLQTSGMGAMDLIMLDSLERMRERRATVRSDSAEARAKADSGYNIFGLEMFRLPKSRFDANATGPVDPSYRLNAGDRLVLILTGDVQDAYSLEVAREGFVVIPQVGQLYVANLTLAQLEDLLYARLGRVYSGVRRGAGATTRFSVSVSRMRNNQVFVLGEVEHPGSHVIGGTGTALTALYSAGGPTPNGSLRQVQVRRNGQTIAAVDLYDYLLRGDASNDVRLENGDIVFVPARSLRVRVVGEVVRPATYELKPGETLADVIRAAGGFSADASQRRIQIERILPPSQRSEDGRDRVTIDVTAQGSPAALVSTQVMPGDVVRVYPVADRVRNTVYVSGHVWNPGPVGLGEGRMLSDVLRAAGGLKPDVYLGRVLVSRLRPDSTRAQLHATLRDTSGAVLNDFPVQEDDHIEVFSLSEFRPERYVAIGGAVRESGRYPYRVGMTLRDLVLLAGGLLESAYLKEAEIARLPEDRTGLQTARTIRVALDSTYLFERRAGMEYLGAPGIQTSANGAPDFPLAPYDNVMIMQQPNWELQRIVSITGEVRFPGTYALKTRDERLSDIIARAGGLTSEAYPEGTVFTRTADSVGRVAIDVPLALRRHSSPENLLLVDGDQIVIPRRSGVITVQGAVNAPNVVAYVEGENLDYYIAQAGGPMRRADEDRAYVTQPNGKRETKHAYWFWPDAVPRPLPGSVVEVPERDAAESVNYAQMLGALAPIISSLATVAVVLITRN